MLDAILVGQGLAGTTLAWHLQAAGWRTLLLDAGETATASRVAAGLMTPITGLRLTLNWQSPNAFDEAIAFYRGIESRTRSRFLIERDAVRLFDGATERRHLRARSVDAGYRSFVTASELDPQFAAGALDATSGGFMMRAAQLDMPAYLEASRRHLATEVRRIDWGRDVSFSADRVSVAGHEARMVISCEGAAAMRHPLLATLPFRPSKGEILDVTFAAPLPDRVIHKGIWIAPGPEAGTYRAGATYAWDDLTTAPTDAARAELEQRVDELVHMPHRVIGQRAAIRPSVSGRRGVVGMHPRQPRLGCFNGLASRGAVHAPWFARTFSQHLVHGLPLADEIALASLV
jgi:glycine/D-amino acid oxidase-like deaminating enzyme